MYIYLYTHVCDVLFIYIMYIYNTHIYTYINVYTVLIGGFIPLKMYIYIHTHTLGLGWWCGSVVRTYIHTHTHMYT